MHPILWASILAGVPARHAHPMTFHADFWVVAGTAAPVIALSSILVLGDLLKMHQDVGRVMGMEGKGLIPVWEWPYSIGTFEYLLALTVTVLQAAILFFSLMSLAQEHNYAPTAPIAVAESISLMALSLITLGLVRLRWMVRHLEEVHFPPPRTRLSPRPSSNSKSDSMRRAAIYRSSHQITNARCARRAPQPRNRR